LARKIRRSFTPTRAWALALSFVIVTSGVSLAETVDATDAFDDSMAVAAGSGANPIDVLANDSSVPGGTLTITEVIGDFVGSVTVTNEGLGLNYEPAVDFCGVESFTYTVSDGLGGTASATVTVEVTCEPAEEEPAVDVTDETIPPGEDQSTPPPSEETPPPDEESPPPPVEESPPPSVEESPPPPIEETTPPEETTTTTVPTEEELPELDLSTAANLIVKLVAGLGLEEQSDVIASHGGVETSAIPVLRLHMVAVAPDMVEESVVAFAADPAVVSVDLDLPRTAEAVSNDPEYSDQWALPLIGWEEVYGVVTPAGSSTLAVLDTGVDASNPDLADRVVGGWSFDGADPASDASGHGTAVATIAAAGVNDGVGIAGVGYSGVSIMPVRVLGDDGTGQDSDIISGLVWAVDHGADVVVMAFSNPGESAALQFAVNYAWANGVVLVAAAGNDGGIAPTYPAGLAKVVGVGATDSSDNVWSESNQSNAVFMVAPGVDIAASNGGVTGTSASAAMVAGAAAVMQANDSSASQSVIVGRLARNADPATGVAGNGRLNLARSISDPSTDGVTPAGAPGGGPIVGPYVAAAADYITGRVLLDTDGDGVDDDGGVGLAGATVKLYRDSNTNNTFDPATDALLGTVTTISGGTNGSTGTSGAWAFRQNGAMGLNEVNVTFNNNTRYFVQRTNPLGYTSTSALLGTIGGTGTGHSHLVVSADVITIRFGNANPTYSNARFLANVSVVTADLSITKLDSPDPVLPGAALNYTIAVSNAGPGAVAGAVVGDTFPASLTGVTWSCTVTSGTGSCGSPASGNSGNISRSINLNSGAVATFTATGTVSNSASGSISNTATVTAPSGVVDPNGTNNSATSSTLVAAPALAIDKMSADTSYSAVGDVLDYSFKLTNSGNVTLTTPFTVDDNRATNETCPATASLAPGAFITCTASYSVNQADLDAGSVTNTATGSGLFEGDPVTSDEDELTIVAMQFATVTIDKEGTLDTDEVGSPTRANPGDKIEYTFDVENTGNVTLTGVTVTDPDLTVTCPAGLATLTPGETGQCSASLTLDQDDIDAGEVVNTADVDGTGPQGQAANDDDQETVTIPQFASLDLEKSATPATYNAVGQIIIYSFDVENTGNVTLTDLAINDSRVTVTCSMTTLAPAASTTCTGAYTITQADVNNGSVTNTATASGDGPQGQDAADSDSAIVSVRLVSTSALTHSAAKSTTEISNQLVADFEILLNGKNEIVATNPGQFFYHQWATNPYSITTSWEFELDWTENFEAQTVAGGPIKAFLQLPGSSSFVNWTSQSTAICWNASNGCPSDSIGRIRVNNVPAGATVWVMAHIDYSWKGSNISTVSPNPMTRPVLYGPLSSAIEIENESGVKIGESYSQTFVWGRGKKVTMLYGTATNSSGAVMADTWIQVKQGTNTAITKTDSEGFYVFFDGQACSEADGIHGSCQGAWSSTLNFAGGNASSSLTIFGQDAYDPTGSATFPWPWTKAEIRTSAQSAPIATITTPSYNLTIKKGEALNRDIRFRSS
jgi:uncharacterized repeat protein (TIGR01451 family)